VTDDKHTCPLCPEGEAYSGSEGAVRAHIRAKTDERHKGRSGFFTDLESGGIDDSQHENPPGGYPGHFDGSDTDGPEANGDSQRLRVPELEPADGNDGSDADGSDMATCPSCGASLGMTESQVEEIADGLRSDHAIGPSDPIEVGECTDCGNRVSHVHE